MVTQEVLQQEVETFKAYHSLLKKEEKYWQLKSHNVWLQARDQNTKFFHKQAKFRESKNNIRNPISRAEGHRLPSHQGCTHI